MNEVRRWRHSRKGIITGIVEANLTDWLDIRLVGEHELTMMSAGSDGWRDAGELLRVRKAFLTEIPYP